MRHFWSFCGGMPQVFTNIRAGSTARTSASCYKASDQVFSDTCPTPHFWPDAAPLSAAIFYDFPIGFHAAATKALPLTQTHPRPKPVGHSPTPAASWVQTEHHQAAALLLTSCSSCANLRSGRTPAEVAANELTKWLHGGIRPPLRVGNHTTGRCV